MLIFTGFLDFGDLKEGHSGSRAPFNPPKDQSGFENWHSGSSNMVDKSLLGVCNVLGTSKMDLVLLPFFEVPKRKKWVSWHGDQEGREQLFHRSLESSVKLDGALYTPL